MEFFKDILAMANIIIFAVVLLLIAEGLGV